MIARKSLLHVINTVVGGLLGMVALKLIALYMGDDLFGQVGYALSLMGILHILTKLSLNKAHTKRMSEGHRRADCMATYLYTEAALVVGYLVLALGALGFRLFVQGKGFTSTTLLTLVVVAVHFSIMRFKDAAQATFNSQQEIARPQTADIFDNLARTVLASSLALAYAAVVNDTGPLAGALGPEWGFVGTYAPELLAVTYLVGGLVAVLMDFAWILKDYPIGRFDPALLRNYWDFAKPLYLVSILGTLATRLDRAMIGYFWSGSQVGLYFGSDRIVSLVNSVGMALAALLLPAYSELSVQDAREEIADLAYRAHRYSSMILLPVVAFIVAFSPEIVNLLLSAKFRGAGPILAILATYTLLSVVQTPYGSLITGMDRPKLAATVGAAAAGTNVLLNVVLIPADIRSLGIELLGLRALGAAIATLASGIVTYVLYRVIAGRLIPVRAQWPHVVRHVAAAGVMVAALYAFDAAVLEFVRIFHVPLYAVLGAAVYFLALALLREFDGDDLAFFLDMVHPLEMLRYMRDELFGSHGFDREDGDEGGGGNG